jgi:hypothetical protein
MKKKYTLFFKTYTSSGTIDRETDVNVTTFINVGTTDATINNGLLLAPDDSLSIEGNADEVDETKYSVQFETSAGALLVITKVFQ